MTTTEALTETDTETTTTANTWTEAFETLKSRYPKVREPIVMALHILMQNPDIALDDAKAQAALHGVRITAASVTAAQRLLSRQDGDEAPKAARTPKAAPTPAATPTGRVRRPRTPVQNLDTEALIKSVVGRIQDAGNAETERLREGIRKAIGALQAVLDS